MLGKTDEKEDGMMRVSTVAYTEGQCLSLRKSPGRCSSTGALHGVGNVLLLSCGLTLQSLHSQVHLMVLDGSIHIPASKTEEGIEKGPRAYASYL